MKPFKSLALLLFIVAGTDASAQLKAGTLVRTKTVPVADSIEYYETDYATRQKSYMNLLVGAWYITSMKRQPRIKAEVLTDVVLNLKSDSTFTGSSGCNKISGNLSIKGTSIKFTSIASAKKTCAKAEEERWILKLLQETVSNYTVTDNTLWLRDGSSNVVFEAKKN